MWAHVCFISCDHLFCMRWWPWKRKCGTKYHSILLAQNCQAHRLLNLIICLDNPQQSFVILEHSSGNLFVRNCWTFYTLQAKTVTQGHPAQSPTTSSPPHLCLIVPLHEDSPHMLDRVRNNSNTPQSEVGAQKRCFDNWLHAFADPFREILSDALLYSHLQPFPVHWGWLCEKKQEKHMILSEKPLAMKCWSPICSKEWGWRSIWTCQENEGDMEYDLSPCGLVHQSCQVEVQRQVEAKSLRTSNVEECPDHKRTIEKKYHIACYRHVT